MTPTRDIEPRPNALTIHCAIPAFLNFNFLFRFHTVCPIHLVGISVSATEIKKKLENVEK